MVVLSRLPGLSLIGFPAGTKSIRKYGTSCEEQYVKARMDYVEGTIRSDRSAYLEKTHDLQLLSTCRQTVSVDSARHGPAHLLAT